MPDHNVAKAFIVEYQNGFVFYRTEGPRNSTMGQTETTAVRSFTGAYKGHDSNGGVQYSKLTRGLQNVQATEITFDPNGDRSDIHSRTLEMLLSDPALKGISEVWYVKPPDKEWVNTPFPLIINFPRIAYL